MKICPNCKSELNDHSHFCLHCMTSLEEKEQIKPPVRKPRRWPLVLIGCLVLGALLLLIITLTRPAPQEEDTTGQTGTPKETSSTAPTDIADQVVTHAQTVDGVRYTFRPATREDHPSAISLYNYFVLIRVEGTPSDGIYRIPSFVNDDMNLLVTVVAEGAFDGTDAQAIDLGYNVRYVWGNAFGGYALTDLYLHDDVLIEETAFSGCTESLTIHCPSYLENTEGVLWSELAADYGFQWQDAIL